MLIASSAVPLSRLGSEFMPPLYEGELLYMPTTLPGVSSTKIREVLGQTNRVIAAVRRSKACSARPGGRIPRPTRRH